MSVLAYLRAFGEAIVPLGPDLFGYVWQTRVLREAPLSTIEARPGVPILGSVLGGVGLTSDEVAPFVVAPAMIVALGLAVAVAVRLAFRLPPWSLGVVGSVVALWGGSLYLAQGHLANLLSLVCIVPAFLVLSLPAGRWGWRMAAAVASATASGFAHPAFLAFSMAVAGLWFVLSIPALVRAGREGRPWWREPSCSLVLALIAASAVVGVTIFVAAGWRVEDFTNIGARVSDFGNRLAQTARAAGFWVSATTVLGVLGGIAAWWLRRSSRALTMLGLAWLIVSAAGWIATVADPAFPGHRALGVIVPLPAMTGLGIVVIALAIRGRQLEGSGEPKGVRVSRGLLAVVAVVALSALVVSPGLERLAKRAGKEPRGGAARAIASYVAAVDPQVPVVVFVDPSGRLAALSWRGRQNQVRAMAPAGSIDRIFLLIGRLGADGEPVRGVARSREGRRTFEYAVEESWAAGGAAMRAEPIIVVPQAFVRHQMWNQVASDPSRVVLPGLAVLRGPLTSPQSEVPTVRLPVPRATWQLLVCLLALASIGGGYGLAIAWPRGGSVFDGIALAPTLGVVIVVLVGMAVAMAGADPAGPIGLVLVGLGAVGGYVLIRGHRRRTVWRGRHAAPSDRRSRDRVPETTREGS